MESSLTDSLSTMMGPSNELKTLTDLTDTYDLIYLSHVNIILFIILILYNVHEYIMQKLQNSMNIITYKILI